MEPTHNPVALASGSDFVQRRCNLQLETFLRLCLFTFALIMMLWFNPNSSRESGKDESISDSH